MAPIRNALTFDVEEYFHAEVFAGVVRREQWSTLESRVARATERLLDAPRRDRHVEPPSSSWAGWRSAIPSLVREIAAAGPRGGLPRLRPPDDHAAEPRRSSREDIHRAKATVEDAAGVAVIGYRAPTFSVVRETLWSLEVLAESGFQYDSSIFPIVHDRYGIPDAPRFPHRLGAGRGMEITEFPLSTVTRFGWRFPVAGGGYFRLFPYAVTRWAVRQLNTREGQPAMVYLHPWEIDPDQPRLPVGRADPVPPLGEHRRHRGEAAPAAAGLRVRAGPGRARRDRGRWRRGGVA